MNKIFIIAPFFPPSALPPSQRVRLLVNHAASFGFHPVIFTVDPKYREEEQDPWILEIMNKNFTLVNVDCFDQSKTRKFKIGDIALRMLPFLFSKIIKYAKKEKPLFILYPVPPWYVLTIAPLVKSITGIPYGIDFIDPWVYNLDPKESSFKSRTSQRIAKHFEKSACKNASIIYSVSQGINDNLIKRIPALKNKTLVAVPYGAEKKDFDLLKNTLPPGQHDKIIIRYIGAIWMDCYAVLNGLMPALAHVAKESPLQIEFFGTSYAGEQLSKPQLDKWIAENNMQAYTAENPLRIPYKKAVELTLQADVLLLIGGMEPYYAASKLMGLLVSKKMFVAFVHEDSFPAKLLSELKFPYVVTYAATTEKLPIHQISLLANIIKKAISEKESFTGVDLSHPVIQQNTAYGMTKTFFLHINKLLT